MRNRVKEIVFLVGLLIALPALAGPKEEARKHYDRAIELIDDGQLAEAIVEFQRAYDLTKQFSVLYNIGQVYVSLAKPVEAIAAYEGYLVGGGQNIPATRRAEVEKEIARQKARTANLVFQILPDGVTVRVDGNVIGKSPLVQPLLVGIGEHVVSAGAEGHEGAEVKVTVAGEDRRTVELTLVARTPRPAQRGEVAERSEAGEGPAPAPPAEAVVVPAPAPVPVVAEEAAPVSAPLPPPAPDRPLTRQQVAGLATAGAGVLGFVTGGVCWLVARSRHDSAVSYWNQGGINDGKAQSLQSEAQDYLTAANVSLLAGGAFVVTGAVLYFVGAPGEQASRARVTPALGPGFAGVQAGGTW